MLKHSFPPVVDERTRLLLLGSLPGEESLARSRYYAHPRNQFWRLIGEVIDRDLTAMDYEDRLACLLDATVGLWDVVGSAFRAGSLDAAIRGIQPNDLETLVSSLPNLRAVAFNGGKSAAVGMKLLRAAPVSLVPLPSSSPALTLPYEAKRVKWLQLSTFLDPSDGDQRRLTADD